MGTSSLSLEASCADLQGSPRPLNAGTLWDIYTLMGQRSTLNPKPPGLQMPGSCLPGRPAVEPLESCARCGPHECAMEILFWNPSLLSINQPVASCQRRQLNMMVLMALGFI